jgi:hypothetical protein
MLRRAKTSLCSVLLMGLLAACAVIDVVDPRYDTVNRSTSKARNEGILLNIVRASHSAPLNFVSFTRVSGSSNVAASAALPAFNLGQFFPVPPVGVANILAPPSPQRAFGLSDKTLGGSTAAGNTYDIGLLETKDFYTGLLKPVDLPIVNFFTRQGYSRELLFWLFAESVREAAPGAPTIEFLNVVDPALACQVVRGVKRCFSDMVDVALASGLTIEEKVEPKPSAGSADGTKGGGGKTGGGKTGGGKTGDGKTGDGKTGDGKGEGKTVQEVRVVVSTDSKSGDGKSSGAKERILARFCFDDVLAMRAAKEYSPEIRQFLLSSVHRPRCKIDPWPTNKTETDTLEFEFAGTPFGTIKYEIIPRSAFGIYQYLGNILALHQEKTFRMRGKLYPVEDTRLVAVERTGSGGCLVDINFEDEYYCVPMHGAENTKRIMGLLAQLVALNTSTQDLAITPTVRAIQ